MTIFTHIGGDLYMDSNPISPVDARWLASILLDEYTSLTRGQPASKFTSLRQRRHELAKKIDRLNGILDEAESWAKAGIVS